MKFMCLCVPFFCLSFSHFAVCACVSVFLGKLGGPFAHSPYLHSSHAKTKPIFLIN